MATRNDELTRTDRYSRNLPTMAQRDCSQQTFRIEQEGSDRFDPFEARIGSKLTWTNVVVKRGGKVTVDHLSGESNPGQLTAILGHSGSGKVSS